ncbi:LCP family glycopolymer transferase [Lacticaseibacillus sharpeae]|uniref:LytR family transcriptional regulator n=1 Tax=Lacticaseibacillus sharpeae JCM 1186 = DSM 20505 TaxID=1291052 RepID=A0A0R1ZU40_9LACO|nr:LCP family protein [Lacticaseibacillus sharpeae]KRM55257.1 LytR family transcriptional regulator [Lacticaseibacillus sharpeae JCM 1186 = DSM 20505]
MKKIILRIVAVLVVAIIGVGGYVYYRVHNAASQISSWDKNKASEDATNSGKPVTYLLMGADTGALGRSYKGRTDTMMVVVLNPKTRTTTMVSIPRDTKIEIDDVPVKINAAYSYGSSTSAVDAVEKLADIKIDGYLLVNMGGLEKLVNAVGGVTVTSPLTFSYRGKSFAKNQSYNLNGADALRFSQMRYDDPDGDYGRQRRQQLVISAIIAKVKDHPTQVLSGKFLNAVSDNLRTDISLSSIKDLALKYKSAAGAINMDQMRGKGKQINGSDFEVQPKSEITRIHKVITTAQGK